MLFFNFSSQNKFSSTREYGEKQKRILQRKIDKKESDSFISQHFTKLFQCLVDMGFHRTFRQG